MSIQKAIMMDERDNVATLLADVDKNDVVHVRMGEGALEVRAGSRIEFGHKVAVRKIQKGDNIVKYGEIMGRATQDIEEGEHVHVHNVVSLRA